MEESNLLMYYKVCHCLDGFIVLIGCPTLDDDNTYTIIGVGSAQTLKKAFDLAQNSTSRYINIDKELFVILEVGKSTWQFPDKNWLELEKEFYN